MADEDPTTQEHRVRQAEVAEEEGRKAREAEGDEETGAHERRAEKAAYLKEKLEQRARAEREDG